jgi:hypothetical protein
MRTKSGSGAWYSAPRYGLKPPGADVRVGPFEWRRGVVDAHHVSALGLDERCNIENFTKLASWEEERGLNEGSPHECSHSNPAAIRQAVLHCTALQMSSAH